MQFVAWNAFLYNLKIFLAKNYFEKYKIAIICDF